MSMDILTAVKYVINLPYFWTAMAGSTMMAMFFGAAIYDGNVPHAKKGVFAVFSYIFMVLLVTLGYAAYRYPMIKSDVAYQLFVYPVQMSFLSIFWFVGFVSIIVVMRKVRR